MLWPCWVVSWESAGLQSHLRIQLAQLGSAWLGPAGHLAPTAVSAQCFLLWVLLIFYGLHQRQKAESRHWKGEVGGRASGD